MNERDLFIAALQIEDPAGRAAYLNKACGDDTELRRRVEALLEAFGQAGSFLLQPAAAAAATSDVPLAGLPLHSAPAEGPGAVIGPYKLLQQIGEGGMGTVFLAEQSSPVQRKVALKLIRSGMDSRQVIARFEAERQALALMDHPNIAKVLDAGTTAEGRPYFVMDLVKGVPITRYCDERHLTPTARLGLFVPVCQAVQHAHQKGIIHRDLKPSNVMVCLYDGKPVPKVIDFGVAKATGQKLTERTLLTEIGSVVGTLEYMSPEQAELNQVDVDTRSDIYSLGVLLYELLTGTTPLERNRLKQAAFLEVLRLIREEEPPTPSTRLSSSEELPSIAVTRGLEPKKLSGLVRGDLDWIVMKALDKDRNCRYETASALAADVQRFLADEPVQASPPSVGYRLSKFVRRNKGVVLAVALVILTLVGGIIGTTWGMLRADEARQEETRRAEGERRAKQAAVGAAEAEKKAKLTAEASEAETKAVLDFVESKIFAAARPKGRENGLGDKVTLRRAVEAALPFVEKSFANQPLVEARLRMTLGKSFFYLGDAKVAAEQFQAARTLFTKHRGPDHPDTLRSRYNLAASYTALGRYTDALKLNAATLGLWQARLGPDHQNTLTTRNNLAVNYYNLGRYAEARKLIEETLALMTVKLGPDHPETLRTKMSLANTCAALGRHADALKLREETLALQKTKVGLDHPDTLQSMTNLANSYAALGRRVDALKLREETLVLQRAKVGSDHPDTLQSMANLANTYSDFGRHVDALNLREKTLAGMKAQLGPDHPDTLLSMNNLAISYFALRRFDDALQLNQETLALRRAKLGPDHPDTLQSMNNLALSLTALGRRVDALKIYEEAFALMKTKYPGQGFTLTCMHNLADSYAAVGRHADALELREEALVVRKAKLGPDHPDTLRTMWSVAANLFAVDRGVEAVPLIDECVRRAAHKVVDPRLLPGIMDLRLRHFEKTRDAAGCKQTAEMWEKLKRTDPTSLYDAACMRAVTAAVLRGGDRSERAAKDAAAEADRAMAWLSQAVAAGFTNAAHMRKDTDLDVLSGRDDFRRLLAELEGKAKK